ncbi:MAG: tetratricopeptide repeat protein [Thermoanaerobaculia bacterium]|nr:tetratricopeptide repeat protein [Thermoanaerobaculia bacterium]
MGRDGNQLRGDFMDEQPITQAEGSGAHGWSGEDDFSMPSRIGPYRIVRRLGAGGMGIVYLADQTEPIVRRVALKVLSPFKEDRLHLARFEREIAALSTMEHPNIARVFDAGSFGGRPFYVMEWVDGPAITTFANDEALSVRSRIELFLQVCEGVHHAHQRGVIHRDLKPGNVLVSRAAEESPRPRIIDFGLARQTGVASDLSVAGAVVGTPSYMSPEQLLGLDSAIDTRTDVYALGVLLYELLVGRRPFHGDGDGDNSLLTLARRIVEEEAPVPSEAVSRSGGDEAVLVASEFGDVDRWSRRLRGDLDWILLRTLAKEPDRRYPSVSELAADLGRHQRDEPVVAGPPTRRYRAGKFFRRHRAAVLIAALAGLLLVIAALGATLAWRRSVQSEARAIASEAKMRQTAAEADTITVFLEDLLGSADPAQAGRDVRLLTLLDERSGSLARDFGAQPRVEASVRHILGRTYGALGAYDKAEPMLRRAVELRTQNAGARSPLTLESRHELAKLALQRGELEEAEAAIDRVLADRREVLGEAALETRESEFLKALIAYRRGRSDEAYEAFDRLRGELAGRGEEAEELALRSRQEMAGVLVRRGENAEAEVYYRDILAERLAVLGSDHPETLRSENRLGNAIYRQRRWAEAETIYRDVAERSRQILGPEHPGTLLAVNNVANCLDKQKRFAEAEDLFRETLAVARRVLGDRHPDTLLLLNNLGNALRHAGHYSEAENSYRLARTYQLEVLGPAHPETLRTATNLVKIFEERDDWEAADRLTTEGVTLAPEASLAWELRAEVLDAIGRADAARLARARAQANQ